MNRGTCDALHAINSNCPDPECYRRDPPPFGAMVAECRRAKAMTQQRLAEEVNRFLPEDDAESKPMTAQQVSDYEAGRRSPALIRARAFADALGVPLDRLAGREHRRNGERYKISPL